MLEYTEFFSKRHKNDEKSPVTWAKPREGYLKINVDGAFRENMKSGGWGFVVRDQQGEAVAAGAGNLQHIIDPAQAEAMACLQALYFASASGMNRVELETDASIMRTALLGSQLDKSSLGVLFREIKYQMYVNFTDVRVVYTPRSCNTVAHHLAGVGASLAPGGVLIWPNEVPSDVNVLVAADLRSV
ncbi:hypothetical protein BAE44_0008947 [Dichanthelium oligosanthes]|uniref:RNase H type-1 domain-containing protein n=1 Tax=Dichanthelium oligosanthes TaxID=888268 RepID=A0A1E5VY42_9POAL|nr:hypothetical protein BAE44_0008947 [Dichanthelium oligosanthes]